jgi:hypothetical protein
MIGMTSTSDEKTCGSPSLRVAEKRWGCVSSNQWSGREICKDELEELYTLHT